MNKQFETQEQWNDFLFNVEQKDRLIIKWQKAFFETATRYFATETYDEWTFTFKENELLQWYITTDGNEALSLVYNQNGELAYYCDRLEYTIDDIAKRLNTEPFNALIQNVFYLTGNPYQTITTGIGSKNYSFQKITMDDFLVHRQQFVWRMGNEIPSLLNELKLKVTNITQDQEKTRLIKELNILCKK